MATLLKLQLSGIRSFGPFEEHLQQLSFDTPVTLLVGQNGCGKTTILEAIKYACTGDLPGGTLRGQGFVHDPKISDRAVTRGQIRLKLVDVRGDTYTITKAIQLQQKGSTMSFSSLDSAISILRSTGEKQQITGRCTDIDKHCSQVLQVSPCILNNVLFCHQENSSWPLDEGKKVKEKFDEIFDSKKYNKCGEMLSKILKTKVEKIKMLKYETETKKEKKLDVSRKRSKLEEKKEKCDSIITNMRKKTEELEPHRIRSDEIEQLEVDLSNLQRQLTSKETEKKGLVQQQSMLKEKISEIFEGTNEELEGEITLFEQKQMEKEGVIEALEEKRKEIEKKENLINGDIQKTQIKLGQFREEKKQFELKMNEQNSLFEKSKVSLEILEPFIWDNPEDSKRAINKLKLKLTDIDENLETIIKVKRETETDLQKKIDEVREAFATSKEKVQSTASDIRKTDGKILQVTNEIEELDVANNKLVEINRKIEELARTLTNLQNSCNEEKAETDIINAKREIAQMERKLEELEALYKILQENYIIDEKLNTEEQMLIKKKTESNKIKNKHINNFKHIFNSNVPNDNVGKRVQSMLNSEENEVKRITSEVTSLQKQVTKLETQIHHETQDIKKYEDELSSKKSEINSVCQEKDFLALLKETYERKEKLQKEKGQFSSAKIMYEKFIEEFEKQKACCPICETDFSDKKTVVKGVIDKLKQTIKSLPQKLMITEKNLRKEEQLFNKLQQLKPVNEHIEVLSNAKIPLLYEQLESNKNNFNHLTNQLSKLNNDLKIPSKNIEVCRNVLADATLLDQYNADIKICEDRITELKTQTKQVETTKSKHEVESEMGNLKADLSSQRQKYDTLRNKLDQHKKRCQNIKEEKSKQVEMQLKYQTQANKKPHLVKQLEELKDNYSILLVEKEEHQSELQKFDGMLRNLNKEKSKLVDDNNKLINDERTEVNKKHKLVEAIMKLNSEINEYRNKNVEQSLDKAIEQVSQLEEKKKHFTDVKNKAVQKITEQKEEIAKQKTVLRNLQDNITLREKQKEESILVLEITNLQKRIGNYNYRSVYEEKIKLKRKIEAVEKEINSLKGQEMELKNTISDIEQDLNFPDNKNAEKNYREKLFEWKLTEKLAEDLKIYTKALHYSILQFHKERMVQINERIRELWRNIYKGNDIDYIQINAEESKSNHTVKQTYDYKVVQVKNGVELEMRGRCSAGQRVLACLIIRMALAESFSSHCGILALDEPTTNLDRENITSLTYALSNIITSHENDNNFQLIVITHDQDFLDILRHSVQNISHYWRISRNPQGYSIIKKERL